MVRLDYGDIYHGKKFVAQRAGHLCTCPYYIQSYHDIRFRYEHQCGILDDFFYMHVLLSSYIGLVTE